MESPVRMYQIRRKRKRQNLQTQKVAEKTASETQTAAITERRRESNNAPHSDETVAKRRVVVIVVDSGKED